MTTNTPPNTTAGTFWKGLPTEAVRGTAVIADAPSAPLYWARGLIGERRPVVRVRTQLDPDRYEFISDDEDRGWAMVTIGKGMPGFGYAVATIEDGSFRTLAEPEAAPAEETEAEKLLRLIRREAWNQGHAQAMANVAWPRERKSNPYEEPSGA